IDSRNLAAHPPGRDAPTAKPSSLPRCAPSPLYLPAETCIQHVLEGLNQGCFVFHRVKLAWGLAPHGLSFLIEDFHLQRVQLQHHPTVLVRVPLDVGVFHVGKVLVARCDVSAVALGPHLPGALPARLLEDQSSFQTTSSLAMSPWASSSDQMPSGRPAVMSPATPL